MKKKEEELRIKMEERNLARKKLAEQRKLSGKSETQDKQQKGKRYRIPQLWLWSQLRMIQ